MKRLRRMRKYLKRKAKVKKKPAADDRPTVEQLEYIIEALDIKGERGEFLRIAGASKKGMKARKQARAEMEAAKQGEAKRGKSWKGVKNTDAPDIKKGWSGLKQSVKLLKRYKRDKATRRRAYRLVKSGEDDPSIVRRSASGGSKMVSGNTRAMFRRALGKKSKMHIYDAPKGYK